MPLHTFESLPILGVGLGFREPFRGDLFLHQDAVDFLEVSVDHYLDAPPTKRQELDLLAAHFPLIPHGLDLSLGSAEGLAPEYSGKFAELVAKLNPPWWSEHLAFTRAGGIHLGHLASLPRTKEAIRVLCRNIQDARTRLSTLGCAAPLILENITCAVQLPGAEMNEAQFLSEVLETADCGLLLDVTNLYTNAMNCDYDPLAFLDAIPLERVVQLHFAGGHWHDGVLVDSHAHETPAEVWELLEHVVSRAPIKGIILERDENLPPFNLMLEEIARAREIGQRYKRWPENLNGAA